MEEVAGRSLLYRWRWALVYAAFLLSSVSFMRTVLGVIQDRGLSGFVGLALLLAAIGCTAYIVIRMRGVQGRLTLSGLLKLGIVLALYSYAAVTLVWSTVERIHFVEYGVLGLLCFHAVDQRRRTVRRVVYGVTAAFSVGFVDEIIQGLVPLRYYDDHDVLINLVAVALPVLGYLWLPINGKARMPAIASEPLVSAPAGRLIRDLAADVLVALVVLSILAGMRWIHAVHWDLTLLPGLWERVNPCGVHERMELQPEGAVHWEDALGDRAEGRYSVRGNRLDGPLLILRVTNSQGDGQGPCVWFKGMRRNHYFEVSEGQLVYKKRRLQWFTRVVP